MDPQYLVLGNLLTQTATPANVAAAAAIVPGIKLPFATFSGTIAQMLRPFPQYNGVSDIYGDVGQSNYNALQLSAQQNLARGLTFNVNYTFSKALGTIYGHRSAYIQEKNLSTTDQPHVFTRSTIQNCPLKGSSVQSRQRRHSCVSERLADLRNHPYATGAPLGPFTASSMCRRRVLTGQVIPELYWGRELEGDGGVALSLTHLLSSLGSVHLR
jgi:hypothetical protein